MKDDADTKEVLRVRVARVQKSYRGANPAFRVIWVIAGITVLLAGLAMTVVPGPALIVVPIGLAMLAAEFTWARRLLDVGIDRGVDVKRRVESVPRAARVLTSLALLCLAGAVIAVWVLR